MRKLSDVDKANKIGIYGIWSLALARFIYVGSSTNLTRRRNQHRHRATNPDTGKKLPISKHTTQYGPADLEFFVLEVCPVDRLTIREAHYIDVYCTHEANGGYNIRVNPASNAGLRAKHEPWNKGKKMTDAYCLKTAITTKRAMADPAVRQRISVAKKGKPSGRKGVRTGVAAHNVKPVEVRTVSGHWVGNYPSVVVAAETLGMKMQTVWAAAKFNRKTAQGYVFAFVGQ